ncbi:hypothetical protein [Sphingobacterium spiritivorum]
MPDINNVTDHLIGLIQNFDYNSIRYFKNNQVWVERLDWVGELSWNHQTMFNLYYSGMRDDDGTIRNDRNIPLVIWAQLPEGNHRILLFDERIHGYNALLVEKSSSDPVQADLYADKDGNTVFNILMWANSSIDFEDEFDLNKDKEIATVDEEYRSIDYLKRNAFDYMGILIRNAHKDETICLDIELA